MAGISSKAAGRLENKRRYAANELQSGEFNDGSGLDFYDFNARTYDQQIGRFHQIDPFADKLGQERLTSYHYALNNPITYGDPNGEFPILLPFVVGFLTDLAVQSFSVAIGAQESISLSDALISGVGAVAGVGLGVALGGIGGKMLGKAGQAAGEVVADAAVNVGQQLVKGEEIDVAEAAIDVVGGKAVGDFVGNRVEANVKSSSEYKMQEKKIDRAERINNSNPRQSRQDNIDNLKSSQKDRINNRVVAASVSASNAATGVKDAVREKLNSTGDVNNQSASPESKGGDTKFPLPAATKFLPVGKQGRVLVRQPDGSYQ